VFHVLWFEHFTNNLYWLNTCVSWQRLDLTSHIAEWMPQCHNPKIAHLKLILRLQ